MSTVAIRSAIWPQDRQAALAFIDGSQAYEHAIEPDRRLDDTVAAEFFDELMRRVAEKKGAVFVAERDGRAVGWGVVYPELNDPYVMAEERRFALISELFVEEGLRGTGIGSALIAACEAWAREHGFGVMMIGVLPGNTRADTLYRSRGFSPYALTLRKRI
jgi:GNAT superfamily N-acetyltransferase